MDLGKPFDMSPCCAPEPEDEKEKIHYPTAYLEGDEFADLPKEGVMVIKFKVVSKTVSERHGEKRVAVDLELRKLLDVKAKENPEEKEEDRESILDKIRDEISY